MLFLLLLIDAHLSNFFSLLFSYKLMISSHLFLLGVLYFYHGKSSRFTIISTFTLGLVFDIYYLDIIGFITFLLPFLVVLISKVSSTFFKDIFQTLFFYIVVLFLFEIIGYLTLWSLGWTNMTLSYFVTYSFAPSLIFNIVLYFIVYRLFKKFLLNNSLL